MGPGTKWIEVAVALVTISPDNTGREFVFPAPRTSPASWTMEYDLWDSIFFRGIGGNKKLHFISSC